MRIGDHALFRFAQRRQMSLQAALQEAPRSYRLGRMCTRREAMRRICGGIAKARQFDLAFRTDGTGPGVWLLAQRLTHPHAAQSQWRVVTYLHPGDDWERECMAAVMMALAEAAPQVAAGRM